jgi:hypothetical protein
MHQFYAVTAWKPPFAAIRASYAQMHKLSRRRRIDGSRHSSTESITQIWNLHEVLDSHFGIQGGPHSGVRNPAPRNRKTSSQTIYKQPVPLSIGFVSSTLVEYYSFFSQQNNTTH